MVSSAADVTMLDFQDLINQKEKKKLSVDVKAKIFIAANLDLENATLEKFCPGVRKFILWWSRSY